MEKWTKTPITIVEFEQVPEHNNRVFEINYVTKGGIIRHYKVFKKKEGVRRYIDNPLCEDLKLAVCEVNHNES